jgi:hypothetical protein
MSNLDDFMKDQVIADLFSANHPYLTLFLKLAALAIIVGACVAQL